MGKNSAIEWTRHTFNPWRGCARVSEGCRHCYAETLSKRNPKLLGVWGVDGTRVVASESMWGQPLKWDAKARALGERHRVFCASMADWLEDRRDLDASRHRLFDLIAITPNLEWLLLTKRPENFDKLAPGSWVTGRCPSNVRVGVTAENQPEAERRIQILLRIQAANFISVEPMLGPVDLEPFFDNGHESNGPAGWVSGPSIDWVVAGGESGHDARPMRPDWIRALRDQCAAAGVPFLFKQWGEWTPGVNLDRTSGTVRTATWFNNRWSFGAEDLATTDGHADDEPDLYRVGKKAAGRLLDGCEWNQFPEARS